MLLSLICLRQMKKFYRRNYKNNSSRIIKTKCSLLYKYKLMSPIINLDKHFYNFNNIKLDISKENKNNLPPILKALSPRLKNKLYTAKSVKAINIFKPEIKPRNLFIKGEKNQNINKMKYKLGLVKQKSLTNRPRNLSLKNNNNIINLNNDLNIDQNSLNKFHDSIVQNMNHFKEKEKKFRLYSSNRINSNRNFLKRIAAFSPRVADAIYDDNEISIKSFIH